MFGLWNFSAGFVMPVGALTLKCCLCKDTAENWWIVSPFLLCCKALRKPAGHQVCEISSKLAVALEDIS